MIDEKVLIERLEEEPYEKDGGELFLNENLVDCLPLRKVEEIVNQLAEEQNNGWIACSERLPECDGGYICTTTDVEETLELIYSTWDSTWMDEFDSIYDVIAWQPLPAPYQPKEDK